MVGVSVSAIGGGGVVDIHVSMYVAKGREN